MYEKELYVRPGKASKTWGTKGEIWDGFIVRGNLWILRGRNKHGIFKEQFGNWPGTVDISYWKTQRKWIIYKT